MQFLHFNVSPGSAETLVRIGGITNHHSIAYSLSNVPAKKYQNRLMCDWIEQGLTSYQTHYRSYRGSHSVQHQCHFLIHSVQQTQTHRYNDQFTREPGLASCSVDSLPPVYFDTELWNTLCRIWPAQCSFPAVSKHNLPIGLILS